MKVLTIAKHGWLIVRDFILLLLLYLAYSIALVPLIDWFGFSTDGTLILFVAQLEAVLALLAAYYSLAKLRTLHSLGLGFSMKGRGKDMVGGF